MTGMTDLSSSVMLQYCNCFTFDVHWTILKTDKYAHKTYHNGSDTQRLWLQHVRGMSVFSRFTTAHSHGPIFVTAIKNNTVCICMYMPTYVGSSSMFNHLIQFASTVVCIHHEKNFMTRIIYNHQRTPRLVVKHNHTISSLPFCKIFWLFVFSFYFLLFLSNNLKENHFSSLYKTPISLRL